MPKKTKDHSGTSDIEVEYGWDDSATFVVKARMSNPPPADMPEPLRDSLILTIVASSLRHEADEMAKSVKGRTWEVHETPPSGERSH